MSSNQVTKRDIELAMRNATRGSFYVCLEEDVAARTVMATSLRMPDLKIVTEETMRRFLANPVLGMTSEVAYDPAVRRTSGRVPAVAAPSVASPVEGSSNPGGSA